jgi:DNA-binding transcriptional regulator YiaG
MSSPCSTCPRLRQLLENPTPKALLAHGLSPSRLAELLGVSRSTTCRWYKSGRIPDSARYDVARELLAVVQRGGHHHA